MPLLTTGAGIYGSGGVAAVDTPPNTLFGANLWSWLNPTTIATDGGSNVTFWDDASGNERWGNLNGSGPQTTTIGPLAAVNMFNPGGGGGGGFTRITADPDVECGLQGITQLTTWGVASFRSPTGAYGGFAGYCPTNTGHSYDTGGAWLGVQRDNTNNALNPGTIAGGTGSVPAIAITPSDTVYRFCTVWDGSSIYFYINNVLQAGYPATWAGTLGGGGNVERIMYGAAINSGSPAFYWDGKIGEITIVTGMVPSAYQLACYDLNLKNKFGL